MIDIHCHIIPGVDDGSEDFAESVSMGEAAASSGVTDIIVTPHCNIPDMYRNYAGQGYDRAFEGLEQLFEENGVRIRLHRGMEVFGTDNIGRLIDDGRVITMAGSRYMLVEFPFDDDMWRLRDVLYDMWRRGVVPIIAHPERYYAVQDDVQFALDWADMGCLLQLNRTSILAHPSAPEAKTAKRILDMGAAHFVATDAHGVFSRTAELLDVYEYVSERYSREWAEILMVENPQRLIENRRILRLPMRERY